jgi:hypothetical protein
MAWRAPEGWVEHTRLVDDWRTNPQFSIKITVSRNPQRQRRLNVREFADTWNAEHLRDEHNTCSYQVSGDRQPRLWFTWWEPAKR